MSTKKFKNPDGNTGENKNKDGKNEPMNVRKELLSWIEIFIIAAALAFCINKFIIANSVVPTSSMEPMIMAGDRVFGSRLTYGILGNDPQRGDVVIFHWPDDEKTYFVKRVIGMPGETIDIVQGQVYINGEPLDEPYIAEPMRPEGAMHFEVPEGAYFMMGDNRNCSLDARYWDNTYVYRNKIIAKCGIKYFPLPMKVVE